MRGALSAGAAVIVMLVAGCTAEPEQSASPAVIVPHGPGEAADVVQAERAAEQARQVRVSDADVDYMRMMIPHHEQALVMTDLVPDRSRSARVQSIAERIAVAQDGEIAMMRSWLDEHAEGHGDKEHEGREGHSDHGDHGDHSDHDGHAGHDRMPGMATEEQLAELRAATGEEFDRLFCELMITHHEGALTMAEDYLPRGLEPRALAMAQEVVTTQTAEIEHLRAMMP
ncbi:DUF305 domain-containing protein [Saccharomonospora xinjiangensis]|uniref:DUF305 domain-containing protein n=1 Tax=Saccharomonospora xinjiangensis TaxID=75294 RepID=UPI00106F6AAD|nr:DUF305 domain-containing protein [Saccharomonospora xinjiangensis]QBQ59668.1 hypothetical protein EYD13_06500 [Saccharomonospora xinjiangensis]